VGAHRTGHGWLEEARDGDRTRSWHPGAVTITRRTALFAQIAQQTDEQLRERGIVVEPQALDAVINHRVDQVAGRLRVSARTALLYAPADLPTTLVNLIVDAINTSSNEPAEGTRRGGLRVVDERP